jgi:hypothetical protein
MFTPIKQVVMSEKISLFLDLPKANYQEETMVMSPSFQEKA